MQNFQQIEYHQTRDFSRKMNATFEFIKQNWKSLGKATLFIAGPPVFIASLMMGSSFADMFSLSTLKNPEAPLDMFMSPTFWLQMILAMILFVLATVMSLATINSYIMLYEELRTNEIPVSLVWDRVRKTFWMYFGTIIYFFLTYMALYMVIVIPIAIIAAFAPAIIIFSGFAVFALMIALVYLMFSVSLTFIIRAYEGLGFFAALKRSFILVKGKWWSTFGLILILYMIMGTISSIPIFPVYIIMGITVLHDVSNDPTANPMQGFSTVLPIMLALYYTLQLLLSALPNIGIAFQYFNLVERKEARGLMSSIDSFGETPAPPHSDETF